MIFLLAYVKKKQYLCGVKRIGLIVLLLCAAVTCIMAENNWDYINRRNELRIGWGDQLFETLMWHNPTSVVTAMPAEFKKTYHENFHYSQHLWIEYQWRFAAWFSLGGMIDLSEVGWDDVTRDGTGKELTRTNKHYFYNAVVMPTIRFTWFHHEYVNLYSGLGIGMGINGGSEFNTKNSLTDIGVATDLTLIGVSANYQQWFWTVDFGGLYSLRDANTIFMASSRIISIGLGVRF